MAFGHLCLYLGYEAVHDEECNKGQYGVEDLFHSLLSIQKVVRLVKEKPGARGAPG